MSLQAAKRHINAKQPPQARKSAGPKEYSYCSQQSRAGQLRSLPPPPPPLRVGKQSKM